jgi:hypothetical protein
MRNAKFSVKRAPRYLAPLLLFVLLWQNPIALAQEKTESPDAAAKPVPVQEVTLAPQAQSVPIRKGVSVNKAPRSLFLIKRKIDESEFGEPTIYPFERHQRVISYDQRMEDPLSNQR